MLRVAENFQKSNLTVRKRGMAGSCQFRLRLSTDGRPADILAPSPPALLRGSRRIRRRIFSTVHFCVVPCGLSAHSSLYCPVLLTIGITYNVGPTSSHPPHFSRREEEDQKEREETFLHCALLCGFMWIGFKPVQ